ncbi:MAG TPA: hypothetical protein VF535_00675 [Allosphingosinicella sp.]|jgi:hypothetical protein
MQPFSSPSKEYIPPLPELIPPAAAGPDPQPASNEDGFGNLAHAIPSALVPAIALRSVRCGCWLLNYTPTGSGFVTFDGTMRVECHDAGRTASGDLYQRGIRFAGFPPRPVLGPAPNPAGGIPIFGRSRYRYYVRVTEILERFTLFTGFRLGFQLYRFDAAAGSWASEGDFSAQMTWIPAPSGYPSANNYLEGDVRNSSGTVVGRLKMGWLSTRLRRVVVEIDTVAGSERPVDNGSGVGWAQIFDAVNWEANVLLGDTNVAQPSGPGWSDGEMHAAMLARRDPVSLDSEWRYHILAVRTIDSTPRGIMYDAGGSDSNNVPREGVGISTHWTIPNTADWGLVRGQRFGAAPAPFFRTAVHELGHALGLYHNTVDNGFMNTTDVIAGSATAANPFPNNIKWAFADDDLKRLRHYPDVFVRPGGTAFGTASNATPPITPTDRQAEMPGLELAVTPLLGEVPIGAPVRVRIELRNVGDFVQRVPARLSLKTDFVRGWVIDASGARKSFSPLVRCIEDKPMRDLDPGDSVAYDLTLLRGSEGALFPAGGLYEVLVEISWEVEEVEAVVAGRASLLVTGAASASHAAAAHWLLATPDAHLVLALGGEHLDDGIRAIHAALDDEVLRPHYAVIEARRIATLDQRAGRKVRAEVRNLLADDTVMSQSESEKLDQLVGNGKPPTVSARVEAGSGAKRSPMPGRRKRRNK